MICNIIILKLHDGDGGFNILRLATSPYDIVFNGDTYTSTGDVLGIDDSENSKEISKTGLTLTMSGIDPTFQAQLDSGGFVRAPIDILTVNVPEDSNIVSTYQYYHRGYADTPVTSVDFNSGTLSLTMETDNVFTDIDKVPNLLRSSMATHSSRHAGDKFFEYISNVDETQYWKGDSRFRHG